MGFLLETFWGQGGDFWRGGIRVCIRRMRGIEEVAGEGWCRGNDRWGDVGDWAGRWRWGWIRIKGDKKERDGGRVSSVSLKLSGGYLLSHRNSTIGVTGLNFSVRNGKRWIPGAIATLYDKTYWQG